MTTKRSHSIPALLFGLVLVLALAGCGGQPFPTTAERTTTGGSTPQARLLAAVKNTNAAKTAHFAVDMSMSGLGEMGAMKVTGSGAMDLAHKRFSMAMSSSGAGAPKLSVEVRVVGSTTYVNAGSGWTSQSVSAVGALTPIPTSYLDYLKGLGGAVREEGHEKVRGEDTTRYSATVDLAHAASRLGSAKERAVVKPMLDLLGLTKIPVTVWVDDAGRMRKMTMTMDLSALGDKLGAPAGFEPKMKLTMEMYDFGVPVSVAVPSGAKKAAGSSGTTFCLADSCAASDGTATMHDIQSDLRDALTAEKVTYTDNMAYSDDVTLLKDIESTLDWGGRLKVVVGDSAAASSAVVCLSETANGVTYTIADVASGPRVGTYFDTTPCPSDVNETSFATFGSRW